MSKLPRLGSPQWVESVFASQPVRNTKGPAKHTHHHQSLDHVTGLFVGTEGRIEHCALQLIKHMRSLGIIKRYKGQPFKTDQDEFGAEIIPDFFVELCSGELLVIECKTARFITRQLDLVLDSNRERFKEFGIRYLVWTGRHPLNHATRHNLIMMAQAASSPVSQNEVADAVRYVNAHPHASLADLNRDCCDRTVLLSAAHSLHLHYRLNEPLTPSTQFSTRPLLDFKKTYLAEGHATEYWWSSL